MTKEVSLIINKLKDIEITAEPITFKLTDFSSSEMFAEAMFACTKLYKDSEDIVVRYSKPYNEDKTDVIVQFQILRSKAKIFYNYLKWNETKINCFLTSNKEIKEAIKFFNSLGVKGEDMIPLSSKDGDYTSLLKEGLEAYNKRMEELGENTVDSIVITISMGHDDGNEVDYPMLSYDFMNCNGCSNFADTKEWIKSGILKIK
jgi:hypothetical protein